MNRIKLISLVLGMMLMPYAQADRSRYYDYGHHRDFDHYGWINSRQEKQHWSIDKGAHKGQLTHHEERKLRRQQNKIAKLERRFLRDGWLSRKEHHILEDRLDHASERIHDFKHNYRVNRHRHSYSHDYYPERSVYRHDKSGHGGYPTYRTSVYSAGMYFNW